jgi:hypothetical protein
VRAGLLMAVHASEHRRGHDQGATGDCVITIAIDPGEHRSACAVFDAKELVSLEWIKPGEVWPGVDMIDQAVVEKPRLYPGHPRPGNILNLGWGGALVVGALRCLVHEFEPSQWKGSVKKPQHHMRVWMKLDPLERALFPAGTEVRIAKGLKRLMKTRKVTGYSFEAHNLLDACALGMFFLGRTPKGG